MGRALPPIGLEDVDRILSVASLVTASKQDAAPPTATDGSEAMGGSRRTEADLDPQLPDADPSVVAPPEADLNPQLRPL